MAAFTCTLPAEAPCRLTDIRGNNNNTNVAAADAPPQRWEHELALMLEPGKADVANARLQPPDVDISDIAVAAEGGARSLSFVVREVHARLADQLSRAADIGGTQPQGWVSACLPAPAAISYTYRAS